MVGVNLLGLVGTSSTQQRAQYGAHVLRYNLRTAVGKILQWPKPSTMRDKILRGLMKNRPPLARMCRAMFRERCPVKLRVVVVHDAVLLRCPHSTCSVATADRRTVVKQGAGSRDLARDFQWAVDSAG